MRAKSASLSSAGGSDPAGRAVSLSAPAADTTAIMADSVTMLAAHRAVSPAAADIIMSLLSLAPAQLCVGFDCVRRFLLFNAAVGGRGRGGGGGGRRAGARPGGAAE